MQTPLSYLLFCGSIDVFLQPDKLGVEVFARVLRCNMLLRIKLLSTIDWYRKCRHVPRLFPVSAEVRLRFAIRLWTGEYILPAILVLVNPVEELGNLR